MHQVNAKLIDTIKRQLNHNCLIFDEHMHSSSDNELCVALRKYRCCDVRGILYLLYSTLNY